jgi:FtsZ-binding cell division protein ZapB
MAQRIAIRIDVGPAAPLDLIIHLVQSTNTVCNVALALDRQSELNRATRWQPLDEPSRIELIEYLQLRQHRPFEDDYPDKYLSRRIPRILERLLLSAAAFGGPGAWPPAEAQAAYLLEALPDSGPLVPTVERISYSNPLKIVLTGFTWGHVAASGGSLLALLNFVAYVGPKREKMKAEAQKTRTEAGKLDAEAHQIHTDTECKAEVTRALLGRVRDGDAVLTPQQIDAIVDDEAISAILELTQRPLEIKDKNDDKAS